MSPSGYIQSRQLATLDSKKIHIATLVDNRPYLPNLIVDASDEDSIRLAALATVLYNAAKRADGEQYLTIRGLMFKVLHDASIPWDTLKEEAKSLSCVKVTGGITNALFRVSGFQSLIQSDTIKQALSDIHSSNYPKSHKSTLEISSLVNFDSILIRIFGAEGMIDRDVETATYAALCRAGVAHDYVGRFQNGRIEGWLEGYVPLKCKDLQSEETSIQLAKEMARLHCLFRVPEGELREHHGDKVGLWDQLKSWMEQAKGYTEFKTETDTERVKGLELNKIEAEVYRFIELYKNADDKNATAFCHNDMLPANIMHDTQTNKFQLIDFEYGGTNFKAFDIANHFNEYAGGTTAEEDATPDYSKFPNQEKQMLFCTEYIKTKKELQEQNHDACGNEAHNVHQETLDLLAQVKDFVLINHLYWGLWAVNQAAEEGCDEFDYITYGTNRFNEFYRRKTEWGGTQ